MRLHLARLAVAALGLLGLGCAPMRAGTAGAPSASTKAGSMARFIVHHDHLYALNGSQLRTYEATSFGLLHPVSTLRVPADAETLFPHGDLLFVGAQNGMLVYSLDDPGRPDLVGRAAHVVSCDPVVVEGDVAYVTLRSGTGCRRGVDALLVFDVTDPTRPTEIARRPLASPHGLGVDDGVLFVADATQGLLVFDVRDPHTPRPIGTVPEIAGYDVIADRGVLFVSADDGLYQYLYGPDGIAWSFPLSRIPIGTTPLAVAVDH
jgi:hypothetical protein